MVLNLKNIFKKDLIYINNMENLILEWYNNKNINPYTGKTIKINGPTYKKLLKEYNNYINSSMDKNNTILEWNNNKNINPYTGKTIKINGPTYKKLLKEYENYIINNSNENNIENILKSTEDKDIISLNQIWDTINEERKIVYDNLDNLITYKDSNNHYHTFEKESIQYMKEYNINKHPITGTIIPQEVFDKVNIKIPKNEKTNYELALDISQLLTHNSFYIDHNIFMKLNKNDLYKVYNEAYLFFNENIPKNIIDEIKSNNDIFNITNIKFNSYKKDKLKYLLKCFLSLLENTNESIRITSCYIIIASLSFVSDEIKNQYPYLNFVI